MCILPQIWWFMHIYKLFTKGEMMANEGNALKDLNCEQLLSYIGDLMFDFQKTHDSRAYAIYYHSKLQLVPQNEVPASVVILFQLSDMEMLQGLSRFRWNILKSILANLQHEVLTCGIESKLSLTRKVKSSSSS